MVICSAGRHERMTVMPKLRFPGTARRCEYLHASILWSAERGSITLTRTEYGSNISVPHAGTRSSCMRTWVCAMGIQRTRFEKALFRLFDYSRGKGTQGCNIHFWVSINASMYTSANTDTSSRSSIPPLRCAAKQASQKVKLCLGRGVHRNYPMESSGKKKIGPQWQISSSSSIVDAARYHTLDPMVRLGAALGRDIANDGVATLAWSTGEWMTWGYRNRRDQRWDLFSRCSRR